jgi:hypothetical protein
MWVLSTGTYARSGRGSPEAAIDVSVESAPDTMKSWGVIGWVDHRASQAPTPMTAMAERFRPINRPRDRVLKTVD